jgi:hypothetical protein
MLDSDEVDLDNPLGKLLQNKPHKRCIQRVNEALPDILAARELGYTWDAIAHAMTMRRPTLINAYNTLLARGNGSLFAKDNNPRTEACLPSTVQSSRPQNQTQPRITPQPSPALGPGIVALGRTDPEKFKI